jgi:opacity protein-like surface antigen
MNLPREKSMIRKTALLFLFVASTPAMAQDYPTPYVGFGFMQGHAKGACAGIGVVVVTCDNKDTSWKFLAGYKFSRIWSVELGYTDFGRVREIGAATQAHIETSAAEISLLGSLPITSDFSAFGRVGGYHAKAELSNAARGQKSTSNLTLGAGLQYDLGRHVGLRAEWQRYMSIKARNDTTGAQASFDVNTFGASLV